MKGKGESELMGSESRDERGFPPTIHSPSRPFLSHPFVTSFLSIDETEWRKREKGRNGKVHHVNGDERKGPKDTATCLSFHSFHLILSSVSWKIQHLVKI